MSGANILVGDCRDVMPARGPFDMILADPPYGDTSLAWDKAVEGWLPLAANALRPTGSLWLFGSMRSLLICGPEIAVAGLRYVQDIVWEKANGTGFAADRFKRVHEHAVQFVRKDAPWRSVFNDVQKCASRGLNKSARVREANRSKHTGAVSPRNYVDDGTRIVRSVVKVNSVRGGLHATEKPVELLSLLIRTSCPAGGLVGDWFAGSGAGGEAALTCGRRYVGCELDAAMAAKSASRLEQTDASLEAA